MERMFDYSIEPGNWCIPLFNNIFHTVDNREIEIGIYREPDDGSYTLQIFDGDDVIICRAINIKED